MLVVESWEITQLQSFTVPQTHFLAYIHEECIHVITSQDPQNITVVVIITFHTIFQYSLVSLSL